MNPCLCFCFDVSTDKHIFLVVQYTVVISTNDLIIGNVDTATSCVHIRWPRENDSERFLSSNEYGLISMDSIHGNLRMAPIGGCWKLLSANLERMKESIKRCQSDTGWFSDLNYLNRFFILRSKKHFDCVL